MYGCPPSPRTQKDRQHLNNISAVVGNSSLVAATTCETLHKNYHPKVTSPGPELQELDGNTLESKLIGDSSHDGGDGRAIRGKKEPGLWGPDGILAVPHVKMVLVLVCVLEVRDTTQKRHVTIGVSHVG